MAEVPAKTAPVEPAKKKGKKKDAGEKTEKVV